MTIVSAFILGLVCGVFLFLGLPTLFLVILQYVRESREVRELHRSLVEGGLMTNEDSFPVRYSSGAWRPTALSMFPWEAVGILVRRSSGLHFYSRFAGWPLLHLDLLDITSLEWRGPSRGLSGGVPWFEVRAGGNQHLFSSARGITRFFSRGRTRAIFEEIRGALAAEGSVSSTE